MSFFLFFFNLDRIPWYFWLSTKKVFIHLLLVLNTSSKSSCTGKGISLSNEATLSGSYPDAEGSTGDVICYRPFWLSLL